LPTEHSPCGDLTIADLFQTHEAGLRRYAHSLAHDADRADDLVQETLIRALANLGLLQGLNAPQRRAWLYRVLKNRFLDEERAGQRQQALMQQLAEQALREEVPTAATVAHALLGQVPEQFREVLHRHHILGQTSEAIGRELGLPAATVRSRLYLARKWIRAHHTDLI